jgi:hypothetical protein
MALPQSNQPPPTAVTQFGTGTSWKRLAYWIVLPLLGLTALFLTLHALGFSVGQENGPMENLQVVLTFAGAILFFLASRRSEIGFRVMTTGLALLFLSLAIREIEVRPLMIPWLTAIMKGTGRRIWLGALWVAAALWFCRHWVPTLRAFQIWVRAPAGRIFLSGIATLALANIIEKSVRLDSEATTMFVEELIELDGEWLMLLSAWLTLADQRRRTVDMPSTTSPN